MRAAAAARHVARHSRRARLALLVSVAVAVLLAAPAAGADLGDEQALAEKHAPVVKLVQPGEECDSGEPYVPTDIDLLLGEETVALRGPWNGTDLVEIAPEATDLVGRWEHHLDFPGDALDPGCSYAEWSARLTEGSEPVTYAHVASEVPGKLALQYWLFYPFNDFNNTHEGDWEMLQLVFDAADAQEALDRDPVEIGYSAHKGGESAAWSDDKLELVDGVRPVVYPAAGSHANKFSAALWLGNSAEAGVGCDDTRGPHVVLNPRVETIPSDPAAAGAAYPWIAFEGRWGELQAAFFNGPRGPNLTDRWTRPIEWSEGWRESSVAIPAGGALGTRTTDFFCTAVETGSRGLSQLLRNPLPMLLLLCAVAALAVLLVVRVTWTPAAPLRLARRRSWGQILAASASMLVRRPLLYLGIGVLLIPIGFVIALVQWLLFSGLELLGVDVTGETLGALAAVAVVVGTALTLLGLGLVQAATACALVELDHGADPGPIDAYRLALRRLGPLFRAITVFVVVVIALSSVTLLLPVAVWLAVRWALIAPVVELEGVGGMAALRRSGALVRGRWLRVASLVGVSALLAGLAGPLLGALLVFAVDAPLSLLNVVAGIVYAATMPFVGLVTTYVFADARARLELEPAVEHGELPAEISLT